MDKKRILHKEIINKEKSAKLTYLIIHNEDTNLIEFALIKHLLVDINELNYYLSAGFVLKKAYKNKFLVMQVMTFKEKSFAKIISTFINNVYDGEI